VPKISTIVLALSVALLACNPLHEPPSPPLPANITGRMMTRADAIADFDAMMKMFVDVHPDLYAIWSRDSAEAAQRRIIAALPESMNRIEWWKRLAPFVASFGDGHTSIQPPGDELRAARSAGTLLFPPSVVIDDEHRLIVSAPFAPNIGVSRGDRIVRVNGRDADSLIVAWTARISGESPVYRATTAADGFRDNLEMDGITAPYRVRIESANGATREVDVAGIAHDSLGALVRRPRGGGAPVFVLRSEVAPNPNFTFRTVERGIAYMNFKSMAGDLGVFHTNVTTMFRQIAADSDRVLIVDLREDGGGDDRLGQDFLRFVTTKPYRDGALKEWKMSAEYRAYIATGITPPIMALRLSGRRPAGGTIHLGRRCSSRFRVRGCLCRCRRRDSCGRAGTPPTGAGWFRM
jgi:hypothetical protein